MMILMLLFRKKIGILTVLYGDINASTEEGVKNSNSKFIINLCS